MTVFEGNSGIISCTSTGAPAPTVTWELNYNMPAPFASTSVETETLGTVARYENGSVARDRNGNFVPILLTTIISNLQVMNAQYPDHDGNYMCIGFNDNQMINTSSATITVQVLGEYIYTYSRSNDRVMHLNVHVFIQFLLKYK